MRLANHDGRAVLVLTGEKAADIGTASGGRFGPDPQTVYDDWDEFVGEVSLPRGGHTDWEAEVVAVISRVVHRVSIEHAWSYVAGLSVGQDLSERVSQMAGPAPQFGLAKSFPGFAPIGPWLVTLDEIENSDDLALGCAIDGETVQDGRTSKLIFSIPRIIARVSEVLTLRPGDVLFTGTPDGVGLGMDAPWFLRRGETLRTWVEGIGELEHTLR